MSLAQSQQVWRLPLLLLYSLHGMVHRTHTGAHPQPFRGLQREFAVIYDDMRRQLRMCDASLHAVRIGKASAECTLCSAERSGYRDVMQELARFLFVQAIADRLGRVNGTTSSNADDGIDRLILHNKLRGLVQLLDGSMLSNLAECARMPGSQLLFHLFDQGRLIGQRGARENECFRLLARQTFQKMLFYTAGSVIETLEVRWLPQALQWILARSYFR